jgi:hypothetical protein
MTGYVSDTAGNSFPKNRFGLMDVAFALAFARGASSLRAGTVHVVQTYST